MVAAFSVVELSRGVGPFVLSTQSATLSAYVMYMTVLSVTGLVVAAAAQQRAHAAGTSADGTPLRAGAYVRLSVQDTGTGMDEATHARLFEPFFTTKGPGKGTDLGLATVYGIVQQSGGTVRAETQLGEGSTFSVLLPRHVGVATSLVAPTLRERRKSGRGELVLLVEDDDAVRRLTTRMLEAHGYTVSAASSAAEALERFGEIGASVRLVLTDVTMPVVSGRELADAIRRRLPGLPILFMSGYTDDVLADESSPDISSQLLRKPFTEAELAAKVSAALRTAGTRTTLI